MDILRMSETHHQWLQNLSSDIFTDQTFSTFTANVVSSLLEPRHPIQLLQNYEKEGSLEKVVVVKQSIAGLASLLTEAAKRDSACDAVGLYLQAIGLPERRYKVVVESYNSRKPELRKILSTIGFSLPRIVDIDWRLDYCVKSRDLAHVAEPRYLLNLHTLSSKAEENSIVFGATVEDLQEIVWKLKEAVKSVEKHAQPL